MKTQIIQIEAHDDVTSVCDKMSWHRAGRILLVWPPRSRPLSRKLDLVLLLRHSQTLGAQLGLVTNNDNVRFYAAQANIPVFKSLRHAQTQRWKTPRKRKIRLPHPETRQEMSALRTEMASHSAGPQAQPAYWPQLRLGLFALALVAFLSVFAALLPTATITVTPPAQPQAATLYLNIVLSDTLPASLSTATDPAGLYLPSYPVSIVVEGRSTITTTSTLQVPEKAAGGRVAFTNLTNEAVLVPANTVVSTVGLNPIRFATVVTATVAGGAGRTASAQIRALTPGQDGNLAANRLVAIEGPLSLRLSAANPAATQGGANRSAPGPSEQDRQALFNRLSENLRQTAQNDLQALASAAGQPTGHVLPSTLRLEKVLEQTYNPPPRQPAEQIELTLRLEFSARQIYSADVAALARPVLEKNLPAGYQANPAELTVLAIRPPAANAAPGAPWEVQVSQRLHALVSVAQVIDLARGLPPLAAAQRLQTSLHLSQPPDIQLRPSFWPRLPVFPFQFAIQVE